MIRFNEVKILNAYQVHVLKSKFLYLLCALIFYFLSTAFLSGNSVRNFFNSMLLSLIILFAIFPFIKQKLMISVAIVLGFSILTMHTILIFFDRKEAIFIFLYVACILFLSLITFAVIRCVTHQKQVTVDSLFGAICGYFLIGFTWTFLYLLLVSMDPHAFSKQMIDGSIHDRTQHFLYFSFTTISTLGYGDIIPLTNVARTFSWLEAITGQIYLAVWISQLVGLRISQEIKKFH